MNVTVIVCVRNGASTIGAQLEALAAQSYIDEWELLVVDNGSTDNTRQVVSEWSAQLPNIKIVEATEKAGLAYSRNIGVAAATGDVLAFCDADDVADPGWLAGLVGGARDADLVAGRLELERLNDPVTRAWRAMSEDDLRQPYALGYLHYAMGANFAVRRTAYEAVGGCDEAFVTCGDDIDLSWRIQRTGGSLAFRPDAVMHYRLRPGLRPMMRQRYRYGRVHGLLRRRFGSAIPPPRWADRWPTYRSLMLRPWHVFADDMRRGIWLGTASYCAGRISGALKYRVVHY